ncbi:FkbM family methyltransferase [Halorubrum ezzemoulense]|uniref:FkbM family methyltransferase n=1 Tax=Halorubrum ezzemoulense TaxID=337243 RepID=UPI002330A9C7|nr:FkbM family methyltransferase [Halorubrum ezzemoulense]MDB2263829.1 FkbM family methyltransferase [Halorubrum ezzemoulense]MDB2269709.1 FkbM family methyltransferase [Halorubrum ezzemoulense]MDB9299491.1 FkbM family methyltransferase [Halorubrum ezzemoulense]
MPSIARLPSLVRSRVERLGFRTLYRLADLTYALGVATPKRTVAGTYWSYEPTNPHGDDPGLAALDRLPEDAVILDVGAHVGEHAIPLTRGTDRRVVAFEPNGESADRLARNAERNGLGDRLDLRRAGVGDANATLTFYRSTFSKCSAFDRDLATRWGASVAGTESVPVRRLDELVEGVGDERADEGGTVPPPDAVKVDVEGREGAVLRGAAETLATYRPLLVVEVHESGSAEGGAADEGTMSPDSAALREWLTAREYAVEEAEDVWICRATGESIKGR